MGSGGYQNKEGPQSFRRCGCVLRGWRSRASRQSSSEPPQGTVRNGSPQLHLDPGRPVSWVGSGHGLFAGFLGDTKQEGLGPDLVNSNSEDLRRVGRTVRHGELPWLTASLPPTPQLH